MTGVPATTIRDADPADAPTISEVAHRTFRQTYASQTKAADMHTFLAEAYDVDGISDKLRDSRHRYFVADANGVAVGFAHLVTDEGSPSVPATHPALLAEVYLDASHQGLGLGTAIMSRVIDCARARGSDVLWLGVWEHNARAMAFYRRWDFEIVGDMPFVFGSQRQRDIVMAFQLEPKHNSRGARVTS